MIESQFGESMYQQHHMTCSNLDKTCKKKFSHYLQKYTTVQKGATTYTDTYTKFLC